MVQKWFTEFRCGRTSTETIPSPGRPNDITTPEMINKIYDIVLNDSKVKVHEIAKIVSISIYQKRIRVTTAEQNLVYFNRSPKEFLRQFVTTAEIWIHHYTPESREGSKQWVNPGQSAPKHLKTQNSAGKFMASDF